jgi:TetR/AcrR family transcriptional repressor of nem operon
VRPHLRRVPSPKKTRNLEKSRKEILDIAFGEIYRHGFQGVSVDDIVRRTSLTKGAFYHHFPTKLDLGYAIVDDVLAPLTLARWVVPIGEYADPLEGILRTIERNIGGAEPALLRTGCPVNNLAQEMAPIDRGFRKRIQGTLNLWISELEVHLKRGQKTGFVRRDVDTGQAAHFIVMVIEGMYGLIKGLDDPEAYSTLLAPVKDYLRSIATLSTRK